MNAGRSKACRTTLVGCSAPPFSGVVCSGRWCGVNVGSRVVQAGFTGTRGVLVRAVLSAGLGSPASCLGVRGSVVVVVGLAPAGQVGRRVETSVVVHGDLADAGHGDRPRPVVVADADRRGLAFRVLVAQSKRRHRGGFLLQPREPHPAAAAFCGPGSQTRLSIRCHSRRRPPRTPADRPACSTPTGHHPLGHSGGVDGEHPPSRFGLLPGVEGVDQVETGPGHLYTGIGTTLTQPGFDEPQALIERKPGCPASPRRQLWTRHR